MSITIDSNTTAATDHLVVPTCIGCGAMRWLGTCEDGCREQRLDLVRGDAYDELTAFGRALVPPPTRFARLRRNSPGVSHPPHNMSPPTGPCRTKRAPPCAAFPIRTSGTTSSKGRPSPRRHRGAPSAAELKHPNRAWRSASGVPLNG